MQEVGSGISLVGAIVPDLEWIEDGAYEGELLQVPRLADQWERTYEGACVLAVLAVLAIRLFC